MMSEEVQLKPLHGFAIFFISLLIVVLPFISGLMNSTQTFEGPNRGELEITYEGESITEIDMFPESVNETLIKVVRFNNPTSRDFTVEIKEKYFPMNLDYNYTVTETLFIVPSFSFKDVQFSTALNVEPKNRLRSELYFKFIVEESN